MQRRRIGALALEMLPPVAGQRVLITGASGGVGRVRPRFPPRTIEFMRRFHRLHAKVVEVVTDFNLVSFVAVSANDAASLLALQARVDHATGFVATRSAARDALGKEGVR